MAADSLDGLERELRAAGRLFNDAARGSFALWRDEVARHFERQHIAPLRGALEDYERALRDALIAIEELERFRD
jgi:hypothetical protein